MVEKEALKRDIEAIRGAADATSQVAFERACQEWTRKQSELEQTIAELVVRLN
jgi:hypothetical protein